MFTFIKQQYIVGTVLNTLSEVYFYNDMQVTCYFFEGIQAQETKFLVHGHTVCKQQRQNLPNTKDPALNFYALSPKGTES